MLEQLARARQVELLRRRHVATDGGDEAFEVGETVERFIELAIRDPIADGAFAVMRHDRSPRGMNLIGSLGWSDSLQMRIFRVVLRPTTTAHGTSMGRRMFRLYRRARRQLSTRSVTSTSSSSSFTKPSTTRTMKPSAMVMSHLHPSSCTGPSRRRTGTSRARPR